MAFFNYSKKSAFLLVLILAAGRCATSGESIARQASAQGSQAAQTSGTTVARSLAEQAATQGGAVVSEEAIAQQTIQRLQTMNEAQLKQEMTRMVQENARLKAQTAAQATAGPDLRLEYGYLRTRLGYLIARGDVRLFLAKDRVVVAFNTDNMFPSGSSALTRRGREMILRVTEVLTGFQRKRFSVEGHTDSQRAGRSSSNWDLAYRRAVTVLKLMEGNGITGDRLHAVSYGDTRPIDTNTDPAGRAANRRVEISVLQEEFKPDYDYGNTRNYRYDDPRSSGAREAARDTYIPEYPPPNNYYDRRQYREGYSRDPLFNDFERYRQEQLRLQGQPAGAAPPGAAQSAQPGR